MLGLIADTASSIKADLRGNFVWGKFVPTTFFLCTVVVLSQSQQEGFVVFARSSTFGETLLFIFLRLGGAPGETNPCSARYFES